MLQFSFFLVYKLSIVSFAVPKPFSLIKCIFLLCLWISTQKTYCLCLCTLKYFFILCSSNGSFQFMFQSLSRFQLSFVIDKRCGLISLFCIQICDFSNSCFFFQFVFLSLFSVIVGSTFLLSKLEDGCSTTCQFILLVVRLLNTPDFFLKS